MEAPSSVELSICTQGLVARIFMCGWQCVLVDRCGRRLHVWDPQPAERLPGNHSLCYVQTVLDFPNSFIPSCWVFFVLVGLFNLYTYKTRGALSSCAHVLPGLGLIFKCIQYTWITSVSIEQRFFEFWGKMCQGVWSKGCLRVIRTFDSVTGRDGPRTFVSAIKYHADYASYDQGQLTSCKLTWLNLPRSNNIRTRACSSSAVLSFNPVVPYGIPLRAESTYFSKLYTGNGSSLPHNFQLVAIGHAIFDVRFLGVGGVETIGQPCRTF